MKITMTIREWKELMEYDSNTIRNYFEVGERNKQYVSLSEQGEVFGYDIKRKTYIYYSLDENNEIVSFNIESKELRNDLIRANRFKEIERIVDDTKQLKYL